MSPCLSNFTCNPVFKLFCWWKLAAEDERVKTGFIDNSSILNPCRAPTLKWGQCFIFFVNMSRNGILCFCIPQCSCYILTYEPWFPGNLYCSDFTKLWMSEHCWGFCWRRRFWEMSRPGDVPSLCAFFQRCLFVTHPHSSRRKNAYSILPPGERDRINFVKYCWLYSSISLRNQSLFPEEHFPSHARKINPLAVYSIRPTILPVTSPLYSRIFSALLL